MNPTSNSDADSDANSGSLIATLRGLAARTTTAVALVEAILAKPHAAFLHLDPDVALAAARGSDTRRSSGAPLLGALDGVPVAVKGNIAVAGLPNTAGIAAYAERVADVDAHVVAALRRSGAVIVGTTNLAAGAVGGVTDNPHYGPVRNPRDERRNAGGSSGGSAAVVAAGVVPLALGTDTMGSVRLPATYCGIAGLKTTGGAVSRRGVVPLSPWLDTVGPIAATVEDLAIVWSVFEDPDPGWAWWRPAPADRPRPPLGRVRVAVPDLIERVTIPASHRKVFHDVCAALAQDMGADIQVDLGVALPFDPAVVRRRGLLLCEADGAREHQVALASNPEGFPPLLRELFAYGDRASATALAKAAAELMAVRSVVRSVLRHHHVLLLPTATTTAPELGEDPANAADLTAFVNVAGLPAVTVPMGQDEHGLSVGIQLVGRPFSEPWLLALASRLSSVTQPSTVL